MSKEVFKLIVWFMIGWCMVNTFWLMGLTNAYITHEHTTEQDIINSITELPLIEEMIER